MAEPSTAVEKGSGVIPTKSPGREPGAKISWEGQTDYQVKRRPPVTARLLSAMKPEARPPATFEYMAPA